MGFDVEPLVRNFSIQFFHGVEQRNCNADRYFPAVTLSWRNADGVMKRPRTATNGATAREIKARSTSFDTREAAPPLSAHLERTAHGHLDGTSRLAKWLRSCFARSPQTTPSADYRHGFAAGEFPQSNQRQILIIDENIPDVTRDAGSHRIVEVMKILISIGFSVTFRAYQPEQRGDLDSKLRSLGATVLDPRSPIREQLDDLYPTLAAILVARPDPMSNLAPLIREVARGVPLIYDTVDLHFVRLRSEEAVENDISLQGVADDMQSLETAMASCADATIVVTNGEGELLKSLVPEVKTYTIPTVHHCSISGPKLSGRSGMMFVGNFQHRPNLDAVTWFVSEIFPLIRDDNPDAVLRVVGSNLTPEIRALAQPGIDVVGHVVELAPYYATTRICVAPLRFGAGIKGKVGESAAYGVPVVGTTLAFDGFDFSDGVECRMANTPTEFARAVTELSTNDEQWNAISQRASRSVDAQCGPAVVERTIRCLLADLEIEIPVRST
jgi:hypothetical protein